MSGTIKMFMPVAVPVDTSFACGISVSGAPMGARVVVELVQTHGLAPMWRGQVEVQIGADGCGNGVIEAIKIIGPTDAVLVATANDERHSFFSPNAKAVRVQ